MAQLEYGDYYKFVASAGIALIGSISDDHTARNVIVHSTPDLSDLRFGLKNSALHHA